MFNKGSTAFLTMKNW